MQKQLKNTFVLITLISLTISCNPNSGSNENNSIPSPVQICAEMNSLQFGKTARPNDSLFLKFLEPIDSINELIKGVHVRTAQYESTSDNSSRIDTSWFYHDRIIKTSRLIQYEEYQEITDYYIIDPCNFMIKNEVKYNQDVLDLHRIKFYQYQDSSVINAFVSTNLLQFEFYINISENLIVLQESNRAFERYKRNLREHGVFLTAPNSN